MIHPWNTSSVVTAVPAASSTASPRATPSGVGIEPPERRTQSRSPTAAVTVHTAALMPQAPSKSTHVPTAATKTAMVHTMSSGVIAPPPEPTPRSARSVSRSAAPGSESR